MATRTIADGGGNWNSTGTWVEGAVPTSADEVVATATSGQLTINAAAACRSMNLTGYTNTLTHGNYVLTIGDSTAPTGGVALLLAGTYTVVSSGSITFASSGAGTHTIDLGGKTAYVLTFSGSASYQFVTNNVTLTSYITHTNGTIDFNGLTFSLLNITSTGTTARTLTFGSSIITWTTNSNITFNSGSNLTISDNTATFIFSGSSPSFYNIDATDFNGTSFKIEGSNATFIFQNTLTINNLIFNPTTSKGLTITSGKTVYLDGSLYCYPKAGRVTFSGGTISKASGTVNMYHAVCSSTAFTGGATWNIRHDSSVTSSTGITNRYGGAFYVDYDNGDDSLFAAYGFYKVSYTSATGTQPALDEVCTGAISGKTAAVAFIDPLEWASGSGTLYFHYKSGAFQSETVNCAGGGSFSISGDFVNAAWKTNNSGALSTRHSGKDIIRHAKSPAPTSIGNGTWTGPPASLPAAYAISSSSDSSGLIKITTSTANPYSTNDIVQIYDHATALTANGVWKITVIDTSNFTLNNSTYVAGGTGGSVVLVTRGVVQLATAQTLTISRCETAWTASGSSTVTKDTTYYREGDASVKVVKASPSNSTLYAYCETGTLDLSSYQKISFLIRNDTVIASANEWSLCLCSDTAGATVQNTFKITAIPSTARWLALTLSPEGGGNLYNGIKSVALYSGSAAATTAAIYIDNIVACTTSGLSLTSLISKNTLEKSTVSATSYGNEPWLAIRNISQDGTLLELANDTNDTAIIGVTLRGFGYHGTTETVTTYMREPTKIAMVATAGALTGTSATASGTSGYLIEYQGGYDTTTGSQTGVTIFDGQNGNGRNLGLNGISYVKINNFSSVRFYNGLYNSGGVGLEVNMILDANCCTNAGFSTGGTTSFDQFTVLNCCNHGSYGAYPSATHNSTFVFHNIANTLGYPLFIASCVNTTITFTRIINGSGYGLYINQCNECDFFGGTISYNTMYGLYFTGNSNNRIWNTTFTSNGTASIGGNAGHDYLKNCTLSDSTEYAASSAYDISWIWSLNNDNTDNNHWGFSYGCTVNWQTTTYHGSDPGSWKIAPASTRTSILPVKLSLAKVACNADTSKTFSCWVKKDHATNVAARLVVYAETYVLGIASTVEDVKADDTDWEQLSITFTPDNEGVVEIFLEAWYVAGVSYVYAGKVSVI